MRNRRYFLKKLVGLTTYLGISNTLLAATPSSVTVTNVRNGQQKNGHRVVFDLDGPAQHRVFFLHNPERLVLDMNKAHIESSGLLQQINFPGLQGVRSAIRNNTDLRIVFDLKQAMTSSSFLLEASAGKPNRLVLDLSTGSSTIESTVASVKEQAKRTGRDLFVAIDAGHGGKDPGAIGKKLKTKEKNITLQIAKRLKKMLDLQPGIKPVLIRSTDRYMALRERTQKARDVKADLFISLHADSFKDARARGASIYALSTKGASSEEARWLADKENSSDRFASEIFKGRDEDVANVLLDLSLNGNIQTSLEVGDAVLSQIKGVSKVHKPQVQRAGFAVLKSPNVPSILLEAAFLSNPREERNLRSKAHQIKIAKAITKGVDEYFSVSAPPDTLYAQSQRYIVRPGDSISSIAKRFSIKAERLQRYNSLSNTTLRIGQMLKVPAV